MSDTDELLAFIDGLLEDIRRLGEGSAASRIEVEAEGVALTVAPAPAATGVGTRGRGAAEIAAPEPARVRSASVGIFSAAREWTAGDKVKRGAVLGSVQSLGAMSEVTAPFDGVLKDVLVAGGAPVEYGQPLFAIDKR